MIKHLLSINQLSPEDVTRVLDTGESFREVGARVIKKVPALRGRTVVNLFYENSTRTRISFELAAKRLSADVINFSTGGSSVSKGESLKDTALTLQAMGADAIVIRHSSSGAPYALSKWVDASVLNAGDGTHEHPTQALLDLFTIREHFPSFEGLRIAIVGDVRHSRVARSLTFAMSKMGGEVTLVGPPTLIPPEAQAWGGRLTNDLDEVLPKLDVGYMLRVQRERQRQQFFPSVREYARRYGLSSARVEALPDHALIMHPGPMNRGVEIASDVADLPRAVITDQVTNGIAVRMSLLYLILGGYTAICAMPNTDPVADNAAVIAEVRALAEKVALCDVHPAAAITRGLQGESLTDMAELSEAGVRIFTDDGRCVDSSRLMRLALEYATQFDVVICQHAQDAALSEGWQMHEGHYSALLGLTGVPAEAEEIVVARDVALARLTGGRLHLTHLSAAGSVELVAGAKARGMRVTADVTPHHLALLDEDLVGYDTNLRVN